MSKSRFTAKQQLFIAWYPALLDGVKAARKAGYKGDENTLAVIASENLRKPHIAAEIEKQLSERIMSANEVAARLSEQARGDLGEFLNLVKTDEIANHPKSRLLKKFKKTVHVLKDKSVQVTFEFELYNAQTALELIGKYHAIFADRLKVDDWRSELIELLKTGKVTADEVREELGPSLAEEFFKSIGVPVASGRKD